MADYWNLTSVNSTGVTGILVTINTVTYGLAIPLLFLLVPVTIIIFNVRGRKGILDGFILASLYSLVTSTFLYIMELVPEYYLGVSIVMLGLSALAYTIKGGVSL